MNTRALLNVPYGVYDSSNFFELPDLQPYTSIVGFPDWVDFDGCKQHTGHNEGVHFFQHDYKFERIWNNPPKYIDLLSRFDYVVQPDFSLYVDFPLPLQVYNKYRNHWLAAFYNNFGIHMIPNISLSCPEFFEWSFMGYPKNSVVAFSAIGCMRAKDNRDLAFYMYDEMIKQLDPIQVLYFCRSDAHAPSDDICTVIKLPFIKG